MSKLRKTFRCQVLRILRTKFAICLHGIHPESPRESLGAAARERGGGGPSLAREESPARGSLPAARAAAGRQQPGAGSSGPPWQWGRLGTSRRSRTVRGTAATMVRRAGGAVDRGCVLQPPAGPARAATEAARARATLPETAADPGVETRARASLRPGSLGGVGRWAAIPCDSSQPCCEGAECSPWVSRARRTTRPYGRAGPGPASRNRLDSDSLTN